MAVTTKAIPDDIAQPRYTEDVYGDVTLFSLALNSLYFKSSKGLADIIAPREITEPANNTTQIQRINPFILGDRKSLAWSPHDNCGTQNWYPLCIHMGTAIDRHAAMRGTVKDIPRSTDDLLQN
jgi:hypothetical protein